MIAPFRFWVQNVMPIVYDDSLSYYEILNKMSIKLNEVIDEMNKISEQGIEDIINQLNQLLAQINELLEQIESGEIVTEAVDQKIDDMVESGEFAEVLEPEIIELLNSSTLKKYDSIKNSSGAITRVMCAAASYLDRASLQYGYTHTAMNPVCTNEIDCCSFVELAVFGVDYEKSRYNGLTENIGRGGYYIPTSEMYFRPGHNRPYGMLSSDFAHWCYDRGYYYETSDIKKVQVGDVAFCHTGNVEVPFRNITHTALVTGFAGDYVIVLEAYDVSSDPIKKNARQINADDIVGFARLPYDDMGYQELDFVRSKLMRPWNVNGTKTVSINASTKRGTLVQITSDKPLEERKPYTIVFECAELESNWTLNLIGSELIAGWPASDKVYQKQLIFTNESGKSVNPSSVSDSGEYIYYFMLGLPSGSTVSSVTKTINNFHIYEGYCDPSSEIIVPSEFNPAEVASPIELSGDTQISNYFDERGLKAPFGHPEQVFVHLANSTGDVPNGYYILETCTYGSTRGAGYQLLKKLSGPEIYHRYVDTGSWTSWVAISFSS